MVQFDTRGGNYPLVTCGNITTPSVKKAVRTNVWTHRVQGAEAQQHRVLQTVPQVGLNFG